MSDQKKNKIRAPEDELYDEETSLLRSLSPTESLQLWAKMQAAFEWQLKQSASTFEPIRRKHLAVLQSRLRRLVD